MTFAELLDFTVPEKTTGAELAHIYAEHVRNTTHIKTMTDTNELFIYREKEGIWFPGENTLRPIIAASLREKATKNMVTEIFCRLKNVSLCEREEPPANTIPLQNGIFNIETMAFEKFSNKYFFTKKLPITYDPNAKCPKFVEFTRELMTLPDGTINQDGLLNLWYFTATTFWRVPNDRWILFCVGEPKTGKTTFLEAHRHLLGEENCTHETFMDLIEDKHASAELEHSWLNFAGEIRKIKVDSADAFLRLAGSETMSAHKKFGQRVRFRVRTKFGFSMNEIPEINDPSGAFASRVILVDFANPMDGKEIKTSKLFQEILSEGEKSGIFNESMKILPHFLKGGDFIRLPLGEMKALLNERSNSATAFLTTMVSSEIDSVVRKMDVYGAYRSFCAEKGKSVETETKFFRELKARFAQFLSEPRIKISENERAMCFKGIKVSGVSDVSRVSENIKNGNGNGNSGNGGNFLMSFQTLDTLDTIDDKDKIRLP